MRTVVAIGVILFATSLQARTMELGDRVCHNFDGRDAGWCGTITQFIGSSIRIESIEVFIDGWYSNIIGSCTGDVRLFEYDTYRNPSSIIVRQSCANRFQ